MQFSIFQKDLLNALEAIKFASSPRTLPILAHVKIVASPSQVAFLATNMETYATYTVTCEVQEPGEATTELKTLLALVKPLKREPLQVQLHEEKLTLSSKSMETARLDTLDVAEFPEGPRSLLRSSGETWETIRDGAVVKHEVVRYRTWEVALPVATLRRMAHLVSYAASAEDSRPVLTALAISLKDGVLSLAAADTFRLCLMKTFLPAGTPSWEISPLPPARPFSEALKKLPKQGQVMLSVVESTLTQAQGMSSQTNTVGPFLFLTSGSFEVGIRLIEGHYPNYQTLIPSVSTSLATVDAAPLLRALETVKAAAQSNSQITALHLNGGITVKAHGEEMEEPQTEAVSAQTSGKELEALFNWKYLYQVLSSSPTSRFTIGMNTAERPAAFTLEDEPGFTAVIMPMRPNR